MNQVSAYDTPPLTLFNQVTLKDQSGLQGLQGNEYESNKYYGNN